MECKHPGYIVKDGKLVCTTCGELSPKAQLVDGQIVQKSKEFICPHCGGKLNENGTAIESPIEDKAITVHRTKRR